MKKIYNVTVTIKEVKQTYIEAETHEEALKKMNALYNHNVESIAFDMGDELDSDIEVTRDPVQGRNASELATENERTYMHELSDAERAQ